jgi:hypothetical protein
MHTAVPCEKSSLNAELIYGKDLGVIQGKTTRSQAVAVVPDYVKIPPDLFLIHQHVTLCIDIMYINKIPFLLSVSRNIQFTTIARLDDKKRSYPQPRYSKSLQALSATGLCH